ncbi:MAG TPA: 8-oxoguanine deaminase [Anaerolineales bacterium]|nr:8-oxoguanine deaminase [Anaerolineales bacterium]
MPTLLLKNAAALLTMDPRQPLIEAGGLLVRDNVIELAGPSADLPQEADSVLDAAGMVVLPGLINTHHHLYQTLTRALPGAQDAELFDWLTRLYPVWGEMDDEAVYHSALVGLAEMALSGCTSSTDHLYMYPNDSSMDATIRAAADLGIRFHPTRGSMSLGQSAGGLPPDRLVEAEDAILADCQRVIQRYHDPEPYSMLRVGLAPCSPFSVTGDLMRQTAALARSYEKVYLHTHVAETRDEERFCLEKFGVRPAKYMRQLGWVGPDVWWAHAIWLDEDEIQMLAETGTGVAHCPSSNMRLGSGIAKIRQMRDSGVKVGIALDGSASNDANDLLLEARMAMLLQRVAKGASAFTVLEALELATLGSAAVIGRDDLGQLAPGKAADFIGVRLDRLELAGGAVHDPVAALLLCTPRGVDLSVINGRVVVRNGRLEGIELEPLIERHNQLARAMAARHPVVAA